jgi:hypothetical protein
MKPGMGPKYSCCFDSAACMRFKTWLDGRYCYSDGGRIVKDCSFCGPAEKGQMQPESK